MLGHRAAGWLAGAPESRDDSACRVVPGRRDTPRAAVRPELTAIDRGGVVDDRPSLYLPVPRVLSPTQHSELPQAYTRRERSSPRLGVGVREGDQPSLSRQRVGEASTRSREPCAGSVVRSEGKGQISGSGK